MKLRVLVVDDDPDIQALVSMVLTTGGFEVTTAASGTEALRTLTADPAFAAMVLDVQMPDCDGWTVLEAVRRHPATAALPVVLTTVKGHRLDQRRGWQLGCDGYVNKPFSIDVLQEEIKAVVGRTGEERAALRSDRLSSLA